MNHWAHMLADLPALGQCVVARRHRVSLPRQCPTAERLRRVRRALCRAASVRAVFATLDPPVQHAISELAARRGGVAPAELTARYGAVRTWRALAADVQPRSIAEQLVLLGWLLPRPATLRHPARMLVPAELRRALPPRLMLIPISTTRATGYVPLILRATQVILLACAAAPMPVRANGLPTVAATRALLPQLAPLDQVAARDLIGLLAPLLQQMGLVIAHARRLTLAPPAARFLALDPAAQCARLQAAWVASPHPDRWLTCVAPNTRGLDWPLLRRKLLRWAEALPIDGQLAVADLYPRMAATFGPLADAQTHGFRTIDRVPWQGARAASVWREALRGPLSWLGVVTWAASSGDETVIRCVPPTPPPWVIADDGRIIVPHGAVDAALLALAPVLHLVAADEHMSQFRLDQRLFARAASAGLDTNAIRALIVRRNPHVEPALTLPAGTAMRITHQAVLVADAPGQLEHALRQRSVRRYVGSRLAPGIALVAPEHVPQLVRALAHTSLPVAVEAAPAAPPLTLSPSDCAALLVACASQRAHTDLQSGTQPNGQLERRLAAAVPAAVRAQLDLQAVAPSSPKIDAPLARTPPAQIRTQLRAALRRQQLVTITYQTGAGGPWSRRTVRPLSLDQRGDTCNLTAFCTSRRAERVFRLDRIGTCEPPDEIFRSANLQSAICNLQSPIPRPHSAPNNHMCRLDRHAPNPNDVDSLNANLIDPIAANAIGVAVDPLPQLTLQFCKLPCVEVALEDAVLNVCAIALHQLEHLGSPLVIDQIIADDSEHMRSKS